MQIDGYSLDAQKTKMKAFCNYNEYEIADEYEDAGKSGKSTHIALWRKYPGEQVKTINGDKPILWATEKETCVYDTPWAGKERWETNTGVPLRKICEFFCRRAWQVCW